MFAVLDVVHPVFPLPTTASPTLQGALKVGCGEAVAVHPVFPLPTTAFPALQGALRNDGCGEAVVVHPVFPLPTTASPTLQGAVRNGCGEAIVACDTEPSSSL